MHARASAWKVFARRPMRKLAAALAALTLGLLGFPTQSSAHPMGNFSISHYSKLILGQEFVEIRYFIDMAEIPTYQEIRQAGFVADADDPSARTYLAQQSETLKQGLLVEIDGAPAMLETRSYQVIFPVGAGGLPTMKIGVVYRAPLPREASLSPYRLTFVDQNFADRAGWKEIVVAPAGASIATSSAPETDRSSELSNYPTDLLNSPPQDQTAQITFSVATTASALPVQTNHQSAPAKIAVAAPGPVTKPTTQAAQARRAESATANAIVGNVGTGVHDSAQPVSLTANKQETPRNGFTQLITREHLSLWFLITAALVSLGLGALHALEPGHGKTIVAAYLVGSRGTVRHAVLLGIIVTAAHTAGVYLLGVTTLYASRYVVPERLYPWLGVISGLTIAGMALFMFLRRWTGMELTHSHTAGESHSHWSFLSRRNRLATGASEQSIQKETAPAAGGVPLRELLLLGVSGGMIPCPAALVVLLSAFALHRIGLGLFLIAAFSVGLAAVLVSVGIVRVHAGRMLSRFNAERPLVSRWLPLLSSMFMMVLGLGLAIQAFGALGVRPSFTSQHSAIPFVGIVLIGLLLGMRHSLDPDHVVAVSTIVSRQPSLRRGAFIGALWGVGHTLTIFLVGSAIILFGVVIPPRIGLMMEFSVALMLVLLGSLNLSGVMQRMTRRLTFGPRQEARERDSEAMAPHENASDRSLDRTCAGIGTYQFVRPLVVGTVHGLAGSAAVALLVLSTIREPFWAIAYLLLFGFGTIVGMMFMTVGMCIPIVYTGNRFSKMSGYFSYASGLVSLAFGLFLVYQIGVVDRLFGSRPQWTPH